jgi:hypothetical protein
MKKLCLRLFLVLAGLAVLTVPGKAQVPDQLIVKVPFQFVAGGRTLPAGEYRISRVRDDEPGVLLLRSQENPRDSVILFAATHENSHGEGELGFAVVNGQHLLRGIETLDYSYAFSLPRAQAVMAAAPQQGAMAPASSGSN